MWLLAIISSGRWSLTIMMTSSNGNIFRVTGPLCGKFTGPGEFPAKRPVTRSFDVFFDLRLNERLSKQPWGWWFETPPWSLWRHRNDFEKTQLYLINLTIKCRICVFNRLSVLVYYTNVSIRFHTQIIHWISIYRKVSFLVVAYSVIDFSPAEYNISHFDYTDLSSNPFHIISSWSTAFSCNQS